MGGFVRHRDEVHVLLGDDERRLVAVALRILEDADEVDPEDPGAVRLRYSAHPDHAAADDRFRSLTQGMLDDARRADRQTLMETLQASRISIEDAEAWMRVIGEARLVLGARAGLAEDGWEEELAAADEPPSPEVILVDLLGRLQDGLVVALLD